MPEESAETSGNETRRGDLIIPPTMVARGTSKQGSSGESRDPRPAGYWAYAALIALTLLAFSPILESDLLWSEFDTVERTPFARMGHWTEAWSPDAIQHQNPIALSSYFIESHIPLPEPAAHRLINIFLHLAASLLLLKVLQSLKLHGAYAAALVFALHPAALQTLFWPGYRDELVGLVFILASLFFAVRNRDLKDFLLALLLALISTLLHSAAIVLPLLMGLCIFFQNKTFHLYHYNRALPFCCIAIFVGVWTHSGQAAEPIAEELSTLTKAGQNLYFYLQQSFFPFELRLFHTFSEKQRYNVGGAHSLLAFLVFIPFYLLIAFNHQQRWARGLLLGLSSFILLLLYGISQTGRFIDGSLAKEEHALYVALPAAVAITFCGIAGFFENKRTFGKILWSVFLGLFLLVQIGLTTSYSYTLSDTTRMWQRMSEQWQNSWLPKAALVESVQSSDSNLLNQSEIIRTLEEILEINPQRQKERILLARYFREAGQNTNALREYKRILRDTQPNDEFLAEAADFFDSLNLRWEANNVRERMSRSSGSQE